MKNTLQALLEKTPLTTQQAYDALRSIGSGEVNHSQIAAFLTAFAMKGIAVDELNGFREAMLELSMEINLSDFAPMDVCGTGGDGKDTFNISTTAAFVVAGAGQAVAKHGNHGVSSAVGSSTVIEALGYRFTNDPDTLRQQMERAGICYLHAPLFHPAMRHVAPVRKELGFKTFFNLLGPLLNPARVTKQLTGVYRPDIAPLYTGVLAGTDFLVVFSEDGYDEISLTGAFRLWNSTTEQRLMPNDWGLPTTTPEALHGGGSLSESAKILTDILQNKGTAAQTNAVLSNATAALMAASPTLSQSAALEKARESLESGRAFGSLKNLLG